MDLLAQNAQSVESGERSLIGYVVFALLVLLAAAVGAGAGLLLVYSTDLPQVEQLEHYRPSTVTELYDDQNRVIGQFALQRRVIDSYNDFPKVLRDANRLYHAAHDRNGCAR